MKNIAISFTIGLSSFAGSFISSEAFATAIQAPTEISESAWLSDSAMNDLKAKVARWSKGRTPSNGNPTESQMSEEFRKIRDKFFGVKTPEALDEMLLKLEKEYSSLKEKDSRFFAAQVLPLLNFRGIVWKTIPVVDNTKILHSMILTSVKNLATSLKIFLPTDQWNAGFDYLTQPFVRFGIVSKQFQTVEDVQSYLSMVIYPSLISASERLKAIEFGSNYMVWDIKIFYGSASFQDDLDRFSYVGEIEKNSLIASLHAGMAQISFNSAFSVTDYLKFATSMGKLYGVDGFLNDVDGAPASKRHSVFKKYPAFGRLLPTVGALWSRRGLRHLQESVRLSNVVWDQIKKEDRSDAQIFMFDTSFKTGSERTTDLGMKNILALISGPTAIRSVITGEVVKIDLTGFLENPPETLHDLLPITFEEGSEWIKLRLTGTDGKMQKLEYRNYYVGRANWWNLSAMRRIFPDVRSSSEVEKANRVLSQSWGSGVLRYPITQFLF